MRAGCGEAVDQPGSINARILAVGPAVLRSGCAGRGREKVGICVYVWLGGRSERWLEKIGLAAEDGYECTPTTYTQNDGFAQV